MGQIDMCSRTLVRAIGVMHGAVGNIVSCSILHNLAHIDPFMHILGTKLNHFFLAVCNKGSGKRFFPWLDVSLQ